MTELEKERIQMIIDEIFMKLYIRYPDDTAPLVRDEDIDPILKGIKQL